MAWHGICDNNRRAVRGRITDRARRPVPRPLGWGSRKEGVMMDISILVWFQKWMIRTRTDFQPNKGC